MVQFNITDLANRCVEYKVNYNSNLELLIVIFFVMNMILLLYIHRLHKKLWAKDDK